MNVYQSRIPYGSAGPMPIGPSKPWPRATLAETAECTDSSASVHFSSAAYRFFSRLCLYDVSAPSVQRVTLSESSPSLELQAHVDLIDSALDLALEDESDEQLFDFVLVHI
jgi:hypothetical protein